MVHTNTDLEHQRLDVELDSDLARPRIVVEPQVEERNPGCVGVAVNGAEAWCGYQLYGAHVDAILVRSRCVHRLVRHVHDVVCISTHAEEPTSKFDMLAYVGFFCVDTAPEGIVQPCE